MNRIEGVFCTKCDKPEVTIDVFPDGDCITTCSCGEQMPEHLTLSETINVMLREAVGSKKLKLGWARIREKDLAALLSELDELRAIRRNM